MIVQKPSKERLGEWKSIWIKYKDVIKPNRKTGRELLEYLQSKYALTEIFDADALDAISYTVTRNTYLSEKLSLGVAPVPRTFYLENAGQGEKFYLPENKDDEEIWGGDVTRIFVGIDLSSGFYLIEGSTMLWDELCCFQGIDEKDLQNYVIVAQYINALQRFGKMNITADE